jgi:circadian clock protein KaiC
MLETSPPKVATGVTGLDDVLAGGFPRGRLYLVEGDPGTGKTTLGLQFLLEGARRGETTLYVTLTETAEELRAVAQSHGWSLDEIVLYDIRPNGEQDNAGADYTILHPGEMELGELMKSIREQVKQIRPARLVLDSVTEMRLLARDALRHRRQVLHLKRLFDDLKCTVLVLDDVSSQHGDLQLQSISHGALRLEHIAGDYGVGHRRLRVLKLRGVAYRDGFHDFRIVTGGIIVFPRLVAAEHETTFKPSQGASGIPELDAILMGPAGIGKSILATQYAVEAAQRGERVAIYLFEEGVQTFLARAAGLGMKVHDFIKRNLVTVQQLDPVVLTPSEFVYRVRESVERDHARVVVIDSLNGYLAAMPDERAVALHLRELLRYLGQQGVLTLLVVAEHGLVGGALNAPMDISYLADTVVVLRYFEAAGEVRRAISVVKRRTGFHERKIHELRIGPGITVGEPLKGFEGVLAGTVSRSRDTDDG